MRLKLSFTDIYGFFETQRLFVNKKNIFSFFKLVFECKIDILKDFEKYL